MSLKTEVGLRNFFIFNSQFGTKEGEELKKILYYLPITDHTDVQIKNVGLVEGIVQFTSTFQPDHPVNSLHTQKLRQLYFQPEPNFWLVFTLQLPTVHTVKDGTTQSEYIDGDVQDNVYSAVLKQAYFMYRLFWGTFEHTLQTNNLGTLKNRLEHFFNAYLKTLKLPHADILHVFEGIQYLPLNKLTFLKVQCFINSLECNFPIKHTAFLFNDHLIWSGVEPNNMKTIYQYLIGTLLPANMETELQGGSIPRNLPSPFASLHHGRFITGPNFNKTNKTVPGGKVPRIFLFSGSKSTSYHLLVYRALSATVCLFINGETELNGDIFKQLDDFMNPQLTAIVSEISEYCSNQVATPSNIPENNPRFIYFNKLNLAFKSTVHLDNKRTGNTACPKESVNVMADLREKLDLHGHSSEVIVKTMNDYWVVAKRSNLREFYVALQQKNASLIDISDEIKKLCDTELKGIFFHPI